MTAINLDKHEFIVKQHVCNFISWFIITLIELSSTFSFFIYRTLIWKCIQCMVYVILFWHKRLWEKKTPRSIPVSCIKLGYFVVRKSRDIFVTKNDICFKLLSKMDPSVVCLYSVGFKIINHSRFFSVHINLTNKIIPNCSLNNITYLRWNFDIQFNRQSISNLCSLVPTWTSYYT